VNLEQYRRNDWIFDSRHGVGMYKNIDDIWVAVICGVNCCGWGIAMGYTDCKGLAIIFEKVGTDFIPLLLDIVEQYIQTNTLHKLESTLIDIVLNDLCIGSTVYIKIDIDKFLFDILERGR